MQNFPPEIRQLARERHNAAEQLAEDLFRFEAALDEAIARAGRLTTTIPAARLRAKVSATVGHDAVAHVGGALAALHSARAETVAAHHGFADLYRQMFRKTYASGDLWKIPATGHADESPALRLVEREAA